MTTREKQHCEESLLLCTVLMQTICLYCFMAASKLLVAAQDEALTQKEHH